MVSVTTHHFDQGEVQAQDQYANVAMLRTSSRDMTPDVRWRPLSALADPLVSAVGALLITATFAALTWALANAGLRLATGFAVIASVASCGVLFLVLGRALIRDHLIQQWRERRELRLALGSERVRNEMLREIVSDVMTKNTRVEVSESLDDFATASIRLARTIRHDTGLIVVRMTDEQYVVEHVRGRVNDGSTRITRGKRCPADRPFPEIVRRFGRDSLHTRVQTSRSGTYFLGLIAQGPLDQNERELLSVVSLAFTLVLRVTDWRAEALSDRAAGPAIGSANPRTALV